MPNIIVLDDTNFEDELAKAPLAVVDFYAAWCGPCRLFSPVYKRLSDEYPEVKFFKVDGEKAPNARASVTIDNLPYIAAYKNGEFVKGVTTSVERGFRNFLARELGQGEVSA